MMAVNLNKGQRIRLDTATTRLTVQLGWQVDPDASPPFDLDATVFLLNNNGQVGREENIVYYDSRNTIVMSDGSTRPVSYDQSVLGAADDDDDNGEGCVEILVDLTRTDRSVKEIVFAVNIYWEPEDAARTALAPRARYNFSQVRNAYILVVNDMTDEMVCHYDLDGSFPRDKGVGFGRLYRRNGRWGFQATGEAYHDGLETMFRKYAPRFL